MPTPIKRGYHFNVERCKKAGNYEMKMLGANNGFYSISYLISGGRKFITPSSVTIINPGCVGTTPPNVYHKTSYTSSLPYERYLVKFTEKMVERLIQVIGKAAFNDFFNSAAHYYAEPVQNKILGIFSDMLDEFENYCVTSELILEGMLHHLLVTAIREQVPVSSDDIIISKNDNIIMNTLHFIEGHYFENPSLSQTAANVNLSPAYFSRFFKNATGSTYSAYLNNIKLHYAKELLIYTKMTIGEIAESCGFSNGNYFCDVFHKLDGISPKDFRKKCDH